MMVEMVRKRRIEYLGHILRMPPGRVLRRFLIELSPQQAPYKQGSLMPEVPFRNVEEMIEAAEDRNAWQQLYSRKERTNDGESRASLGTARSR